MPRAKKYRCPFKPFQPNNLGLIRPLADKSFNRFARFKTFNTESDALRNCRDIAWSEPVTVMPSIRSFVALLETKTSKLPEGSP
jgi:hypothetical protein